VTRDPAAPAPEEPLAESAPLAWRLAEEQCRGCAWNHGLWQYLRLLGLVTSPSHQPGFYREALAGVDAPSPRVLVSGAADYAMLAVVLDAFRARKAQPRVTVIDLCETPLALSRWYAERFSARIETRAADIRDYEPQELFDAVCSDNFFGRFRHEERAAVVAKWKALLRPAGIAVTASRVRPGEGTAAVRFDAAQRQAFCDAVRRAADSRPDLEKQADAIAARAALYAEKHFTYPLAGVDELRELFTGAGFRIEQLDTAQAAAGNRQAASGPSVRGFQSYARLVARA